jgi:hypothetical protein
MQFFIFSGCCLERETKYPLSGGNLRKDQDSTKTTIPLYITHLSEYWFTKINVRTNCVISFFSFADTVFSPIQNAHFPFNSTGITCCQRPHVTWDVFLADMVGWNRGFFWEPKILTHSSSATLQLMGHMGFWKSLHGKAALFLTYSHLPVFTRL